MREAPRFGNCLIAVWCVLCTDTGPSCSSRPIRWCVQKELRLMTKLSDLADLAKEHYEAKQANALYDAYKSAALEPLMAWVDQLPAQNRNKLKQALLMVWCVSGILGELWVADTSEDGRRSNELITKARAHTVNAMNSVTKLLGGAEGIERWPELRQLYTVLTDGPPKEPNPEGGE